MIDKPISETLPGDITMLLVMVKGGSYYFGKRDSEPGHLVTLSDFYLGQNPITNQQFATFLNTYKSDEVKTGNFAGQQMIYEYSWGVHKKEGRWIPSHGFEENPVIGVTWHGASEFCAWLSNFTGANYSLPSESKWEYAARGGQQSQGFPFSGSHKLKEVGWFSKNSNGQTNPVGLKLPNELGIYDMSGNVWEWCQDHYQNHSPSPNDGSPWLNLKKVDDSGAFRVVRGGSWNLVDYNCRVSTGNRNNANDWNYNIGFRVVRY